MLLLQPLLVCTLSEQAIEINRRGEQGSAPEELASLFVKSPTLPSLDPKKGEEWVSVLSTRWSKPTETQEK